MRKKSFHNFLASFRSPDERRTKGRAEARRRLRTELLEPRRLLAVVAQPFGVENHVLFEGDASVNTIQFSVSDGFLQHNLGGLPEFESSRDLDSTTPGEQSLLVSQLGSLTFNDVDQNDTVTIFGSEAFQLGDAAFRVNARDITIQSGVTISSTGGEIELVGGNNIRVEGNVSTVDGDFSAVAAQSVLTGEFRSTGLGSFTLEATGIGRQASVSGLVESTSGDITIRGPLITAGNIHSLGTGPDAAWILLDGNRIFINQGEITTVDGPITIQSVEDAAESNLAGLFVRDAIRSTGTGPEAQQISISSIASADSFGIRLQTGSVLETVDADIDINGQGSSVGVELNGFTSITSTGTGPDAGSIKIVGSMLDGENNSGSGINAVGRNTGFIATVDGNIELQGTGAATTGNSRSIGVNLDELLIESTSTSADMGNITIVGTSDLSGSGASGEYKGVSSENLTVRTINGDVVVQGQGGDSDRSSNVGVLTVRTTVTSTGIGQNAGTITLDGTGGGGFSPHGVEVSTGTVLESVAGDIAVRGQGGSVRSSGVLLRGADVRIESTGTGTNAAKIKLEGTGGSGTSSNYGLELNTTGEIRTVDGDIQLLGTGGANSSPGILVSNMGEIVSTGSGVEAGTITLQGTGNNNQAGVFFSAFSSSQISRFSSGDGDISFIADQISSSGSSGTVSINSTGIGPDSADILFDSQSEFLNLSGAVEIAAIDGAVQLAGTNIVVSGSIESTGTSADHTRSISLSSPVRGVRVGDVTTHAADIAIEGHAPDTFNEDGIAVNGRIESLGTGEITLTGSTEADRQDGIEFGDNGEIVSTTGDVHLTGSGGPNFGYGIRGPVIKSLGTEKGTAARITLIGNGNDQAGSGVAIFGGRSESPNISTVAGDISITGSAGSGTSIQYRGVYLLDAYIESTGETKDQAGEISIVGTGGNGLRDLIGVDIRSSESASTIVSSAGDVSITGTAIAETGGGNYGVRIDNESLIQSIGTDAEAANIRVEGTSASNSGVYLNSGRIESTGPGAIEVVAMGPGSGTADDLLVSSDSVIGGESSTGNLRLRSNSITLESASVVQSTGPLHVIPRTPNTSIGLGGGAGELNLDDVELARLVDGFASIQIGDSNSGPIDLDTVTLTDDVTLTATSILDSAGVDLDVGSSAVSLAAAVQPGQSPGILTVAGELAFADDSSLDLEINGPNPGEAAGDHDQVSVTGSVTIKPDVQLNATNPNGFEPTLGQQLVILENDGTDPIVGHFAGLPEGSILTNFLGADLDARISYLGMDESTGNDIVLTIIEGNLAPTADAGGLYNVDEGDLLRLDASGSSDPDDDPLTYTWDLNGDGDFSDATGATPTITRAELISLGVGNVAQFEVTVSVDDGRATPVTDTATVNVVLNEAPVADAGGPYEVNEGRTITLDATATVDDRGIENLIVTWDLDGDGIYGESGIDAARGDETRLTPVFSAADADGPQTFTVRLRAEDALGEVDIDSASVLIRNEAPTISLDSSITVGRGIPIALSGNFTDPGPDQWTANVDYSDGAGTQPLVLDGMTFQLDNAYDTAGVYTVVVTIDDGDGGVTEQTVTVTVEQPDLPDLNLISSDVLFDPINPGVGDPVNFEIDINNDGVLPVENITVSVQVYDANADAFLEIDREQIASLGQNSEAQIGVTWDGLGDQPALPTEDAYLLVRVVIDPDSTIEETDESNNSAIQVLQVGRPDFGSASLVGTAPPRETTREAYVTVGGQLFYDFTTIPGENDFPVQNASITLRLIDPVTGEVLKSSGSRSGSNGNFSHTIRAPETNGTYTLRYEINEGTLSEVFESTLTVEGETEEVPPRPARPGGSGYVFSPSIQLDRQALPPGNPQIGEPTTITGVFDYELADPLLNVPVTFNNLFPVAGEVQTFEIGSGEVGFPDGGVDDPALLQTDWIPTAEGYHIIQVIAQPEFEFKARTHVTRLVLVGDLDTTSLDVQYDATAQPDPQPALARSLAFAAFDTAKTGAFALSPATTAAEAPQPGDTLTFTLSYENTGTATITGGILIDDFDETLVGTPTNISDGGTSDGNVIRWELGDLAPGTTGMVRYDVTINSGAEFPPGAAFLLNTAILNADEAVAATTNEVTVSNNAPVITSLSVDPIVDANGQVTLTGTFSDASDGDTHTIEITWGDGQSDTLIFDNEQRDFSIGHSFDLNIPPSEGIFAIDVRITDDSSQTTIGSVTTQLPAVAIPDSYEVDQATTLSIELEDSVLSNDFAATSDPLLAVLEIPPASAASFSFNPDGTFTYTPLPDFRGTDQFTYFAENSDGASQTAVVEIRVRNLAPVIGSVEITGADGQVVSGESVTLSGTFLDAGTAPVHSGTVDWGDGSDPQQLDVVFDFDTKTFGATHVFANPGTYTVVITIDDGELAATSSLITEVQSAEPEPGVRLVQGELQIIGTDQNDLVIVSRRGSSVDVSASFLPSTHRWRLGSVSFPLTDVQSIDVDMGDGNDVFHASAFLTLPATINGGAGQDVLGAGGGPSLVFGGEGNDLILGGRDRNVLVGGSGRDRLVGGRDEDVLIGGELRTLDESLEGDALHDRVMSVWNSSDSYADRTDALAAMIENVDDDERDVLLGLSGRDLYFRGVGDWLIGVRRWGAKSETTF